MIKQLMALVLFLGIFVSAGAASTYLSYPSELAFEETVFLDTEAHMKIMEIKYLGMVSPGQIITLVFDRYAGGNFNWTEAIVDAPIWNTVEEIEASAHNITVELQVPTNTAEGKYNFRVNISNYLELRATESVGFQVEIKHDIYDFELPDETFANAGETTTLSMNIKSYSIAPETLTLGEFEGLPAEWSQKTELFVGPLEEKSTSFSIRPMQEGYYNLNFKLTRASSGVAETESFGLRVYPTIKAKFQAFGEGFGLVPILLQPFYSLLSWLGLF